MHAKVESLIRSQLTGAYSTEMVDTVVNGWGQYFATIELAEADQVSEFERIIQARVRDGGRSVLAPTIGGSGPRESRRLVE